MLFTTIIMKLLPDLLSTLGTAII